jgi:hypothetical protein
MMARTGCAELADFAEAPRIEANSLTVDLLIADLGGDVARAAPP